MRIEQNGRPGKGREGFSLIELMIVLTLLSLMAGVLIPIMANDAATARDATRAYDLRSLQSALRLFHERNGYYPSTDNEWVGDSPVLGMLGYGPNGYIQGLSPNYLPVLPRDPDSKYPVADAGYMYRSDGFDYKVVLHKTPESFSVANAFKDPERPGESWMICTPDAYRW